MTANEDQVVVEIQAPKAPEPEAVVSEATARAAFDRVMQATTDLGFRSSADRDRFVSEAVSSTIARHEDVMARGGIKRPGKKQRKLIGGEETKDGLVLRDVKDGLKTFERPLSKTKLRAMRRAAAAAKNITVEDARLAVRLKERLDFLRTVPEWDLKLIEAYYAGGAAETMRLISGGMYTVHEVETLTGGCDRPIRNACTDAAMNVVEDSSRLWGDWRSGSPTPGMAAPPTTNPFRVMRDMTRRTGA